MRFFNSSLTAIIHNNCSPIFYESIVRGTKHFLYHFVEIILHLRNETETMEFRSTDFTKKLVEIDQSLMKLGE